MPTRPLFALAVLAAASTFVTACDERKPSSSKASARDPVIQVEKEDPRLTAAAAEARRRWPEFLAEFNKREPNVAYAVKLPFKIKDADNTEHMWISVTSVEGSTIKGKLDNEPANDVGYKLGDEVTTTLEEIEDWMVGRGPGKLKGLFSVPVLEQIRAEKGG